MGDKGGPHPSGPQRNKPTEAGTDRTEAGTAKARKVSGAAVREKRASRRRLSRPNTRDAVISAGRPAPAEDRPGSLWKPLNRGFFQMHAQ